MTLREKARALTVAWLVGGCLLALLALCVSDRIFGTMMVLLFVGCAGASLRLRCPVCGHPVAKKAIGWGPGVPKSCIKCGEMLTGK